MPWCWPPRPSSSSPGARAIRRRHPQGPPLPRRARHRPFQRPQPRAGPPPRRRPPPHRQQQPTPKSHRPPRLKPLMGPSHSRSNYYTLINQAWTKPQSGLLTPGSMANCKTCQGFEEDAARYVRGGTHYDRTPLEILEVSPYGPPTPGDRQLVAVTAHQVTANVVDSTGKSVESIKEVRGVFVVDVRWQGTAWKINSIKVLQ